MKQNLQWLGHPIVNEEDAHDLETRAAIHEFNDKMPRHEAEKHAHDGYVREKRLEAAAHHLSGMKAAQGSGYMDEAHKHGALYALHLEALGMKAMGPVPPEVQAKLERPDRDKMYRFKAHKGDLYALQEKPKKEEPEETMEKAQRSCSWKLGERRCQNWGTRKVGDSWYCHVHPRSPDEPTPAPEQK